MRPALDALQVAASALAVYLLHRTWSVAATAYVLVLALQLLARPARFPRSVYATSIVLVEVMLKIACSLFACSMLVLFNHEEVVF